MSLPGRMKYLISLKNLKIALQLYQQYHQIIFDNGK